MNSATTAILKNFVRFSENVLGIRSDQDPLAARRFLDALIRYNDDASVPESRPFFFVPSEDRKFVLPFERIQSVILTADTLGVADQFRVYPNRKGDDILYFSHAARDVATKLAERLSLVIVNIGANGLSLDNFSCQGLYTITESELEQSMLTAKVLLK